MPSRAPTSSFEHPAAISATTSRCRGVIDDRRLETMFAIGRDASGTRSGNPFLDGCNPRCIGRRDLLRLFRVRRVAAPDAPPDPAGDASRRPSLMFVLPTRLPAAAADETRQPR